MLGKIIVIGLLILMIYNLFKALIVMNKNHDKETKMSTFIGRRIMFSVALVILIIIFLLTGVITPNSRPY